MLTDVLCFVFSNFLKNGTLITDNFIRLLEGIGSQSGVVFLVFYITNMTGSTIGSIEGSYCLWMV